MFEHQMAALGYYHSLRAMGIDLRGFGQSDKPWDGHDYDTWVADIRAVFQTLDLREVMLVGFQMGGAVAAHYVATQEENRVTRLVLCAATLPHLRRVVISLRAHSPGCSTASWPASAETMHMQCVCSSKTISTQRSAKSV